MANIARVTQSVVEQVTLQNGDARVTQSIIEYVVGAGIACNTPPNGHVGTAYAHVFTFGGGTPPYSFLITVGILPPGLILNAGTAAVSGTPTTAGVYPFTVQITDSVGTVGSVACSITITGPVAASPVSTITGGLPIALQGCKPRNEYDWCMVYEQLRVRKIKFPPSCSIPKEFQNSYHLPWADDFGNHAVPAEAVPFRNAGGIVTPATAAGDTVIISERVPQGYDGLLLGAYWFYTGSGFLEGSGDIVWRIQLNQRFLEDLGNVEFQMGSPISPMPMTQGQILLSGQTARVLVNVPNLSGMIQIGASQIGAGLIGFYFPR